MGASHCTFYGNLKGTSHDDFSVGLSILSPEQGTAHLSGICCGMPNEESQVLMWSQNGEVGLWKVHRTSIFGNFLHTISKYHGNHGFAPPKKRQVVAIFALNPEKDFAPQKPTRHGQGLPPSITEAHLRATFSKAGKVCWDTLSTLMWGKVAQPWNAM